MCVQYLHIACKILGAHQVLGVGWLVISIWDVEKIVSFWQSWKVNEMISAQVSKAGGIVLLLQACFIYVCSSFLTIVPVCLRFILALRLVIFCHWRSVEGAKKEINWECADFLVVPLTDGETKTEIVFVR